MPSAEKKNENILQKVLGSLADRRRRRFNLRMAPMIDMIFLLLIFFLLTANFRPKENFLPIQLPEAKAESADFLKPEPLMIRISADQQDCLIQIGTTAAIELKEKTINEDLAFLSKRITDVLQQQKRIPSDPVEIICQPEVKWQYLVKVYNLMFAIRITDITFHMTDQSNVTID